MREAWCSKNIFTVTGLGTSGGTRAGGRTRRRVLDVTVGTAHTALLSAWGQIAIAVTFALITMATPVAVRRRRPGCGARWSSSTCGRRGPITAGGARGRRGSVLELLVLVPEDGSYFALHKGPRHCGAQKRALLARRTIYLASGALFLDGRLAAGEAELVMVDRWALDEMRVLETFVAQGAP